MAKTMLLLLRKRKKKEIHCLVFSIHPNIELVSGGVEFFFILVGKNSWKWKVSRNSLTDRIFLFHSRELDLDVFEILKCGLVSKAVLDSNMNTEVLTLRLGLV